MQHHRLLVAGSRATATVAVVLLTSLAGCTIKDTSAPPLVVTSSQPLGVTKRDRAYLACVTALHKAHPQRAHFRVRRSYQSALRDEGRERLFRIGGWLYENGRRREVAFHCRTSQSPSLKVLALTRLTSKPTGS